MKVKKDNVRLILLYLANLIMLPLYFIGGGWVIFALIVNIIYTAFITAAYIILSMFVKKAAAAEKILYDKEPDKSCLKEISWKQIHDIQTLGSTVLDDNTPLLKENISVWQ